MKQLDRKIAFVVDCHNTSQVFSAKPIKRCPQTVHTVPSRAFWGILHYEIFHVLVETQTVKPLLALIFVQKLKLWMALLEFYSQNVRVFQPVELLQSAFEMTCLAKKLASKSRLLEFIVEVKISTWFKNIHLNCRLWLKFLSLICSSSVIDSNL